MSGGAPAGVVSSFVQMTVRRGQQGRAHGRQLIPIHLTPESLVVGVDRRLLHCPLYDHAVLRISYLTLIAIARICLWVGRFQVTCLVARLHAFATDVVNNVHEFGIHGRGEGMGAPHMLSVPVVPVLVRIRSIAAMSECPFISSGRFCSVA